MDDPKTTDPNAESASQDSAEEKVPSKTLSEVARKPRVVIDERGGAAPARVSSVATRNNQ